MTRLDHPESLQPDDEAGECGEGLRSSVIVVGVAVFVAAVAGGVWAAGLAKGWW